MPPKDRTAFLCHMAQKHIASVGPSLMQLLDRHSVVDQAAQREEAFCTVAMATRHEALCQMQLTVHGAATLFFTSGLSCDIWEVLAAAFNAKLPQTLKMHRGIVPVVKTLKKNLKEDGVQQDASSVNVVNMPEALAHVDPAASHVSVCGHDY
jgi:hypothetical protein